MRNSHQLLFALGLSISSVFSLRGAEQPDAQPTDSAVIMGSLSRWTGDSNRPPGPSVRVVAIDGKRAGVRSPEDHCLVSPGWHKFKLAIIRVDVASEPTFEFPVQANRKYQFWVAPAGYEHRVRLFDVTAKPEGLLFEAIVTNSRTPTVTWVHPPRVAKPAVKNDPAGSK